MSVSGIPEIPVSFSWTQLRRVLQEMRSAILEIRSSRVPPRPVSNVSVTPIAGGNVIDFTRSDADQYLLYWSRTANLAAAFVIDLQQQSRYTHNMGEGAVTVYYWIKGVKLSALETDVQGPYSGTTLALGVAAVLPDPPAGSDYPVVDESTDYIDYGHGGRLSY